MASIAYRGMVKAVRKHEKSKAEFQNDADAFQSRNRFQSGEYDAIMNLIEEEYPEENETSSTD